MKQNLEFNEKITNEQRNSINLWKLKKKKYSKIICVQITIIIWIIRYFVKKTLFFVIALLNHMLPFTFEKIEILNNFFHTVYSSN